MGVSLVFGIMRFGDKAVFQFVTKVQDVAGNYVLAALPLFIFMGAMLEKSGIAERLFEAIHMWTRRLPGGLAVGSILMGVVFAAASGVVGATETVIGLLAIPIMMSHNYDKSLISGTICAGWLTGHDHPTLGAGHHPRAGGRCFGRGSLCRDHVPGLHHGGSLHSLRAGDLHDRPVARTLQGAGRSASDDGGEDRQDARCAGAAADPDFRGAGHDPAGLGHGDRGCGLRCGGVGPADGALRQFQHSHVVDRPAPNGADHGHGADDPARREHVRWGLHRLGRFGGHEQHPCGGRAWPLGDACSDPVHHLPGGVRAGSGLGHPDRHPDRDPDHQDSPGSIRSGSASCSW